MTSPSLDDFFGPDETAAPTLAAYPDSDDYLDAVMSYEDGVEALKLTDAERGRLDYSNYLIATGRNLQ